MIWALLILNFILQAADVHSTMRFLADGKKEANPVARFLLDRGGWPLMIAAKVGACVLLAVAALSLGSPIGIIMLIFTAAIMAVVVIGNYKA